MLYETIIYEKQENIACVTLNRPERLNAINNKLAMEVEELFRRIDKEEEVRVVILTGAGRGFCAGADIKEMPTETKPPLVRKRRAFFETIENIGKPVLAAINGLAIGGGLEIALACDLRIASETATFGFGEVKIGVMPSGGGTVWMPRLVGMGKAKELLYFGNQIDAQEAYQIGLINKVVPGERLMDETKELAKELAKRPPVSLAMLKASVNLGMQMGSLASAFDFEQKCASILLQTEDRLEGIKAFREEREAMFKGR